MGLIALLLLVATAGCPVAHAEQDAMTDQAVDQATDQAEGTTGANATETPVAGAPQPPRITADPTAADAAEGASDGDGSGQDGSAADALPQDVALPADSTPNAIDQKAILDSLNANAVADQADAEPVEPDPNAEPPDGSDAPDVGLQQDGIVPDANLAPIPAEDPGVQPDDPGQQDGNMAADGQYVSAAGAANADDASALEPLSPSELLFRRPSRPLLRGSDGTSSGLPGARIANERLVPEPDAALDEDRPYDPLGLRMGSFLLFPELTAETIYSDNVFKTGKDAKSDSALAIKPRLRLQSDWNVHELDATLSAVRSFHRSYSSEDDRDLEATLHGRLDVLQDTNLEAAAGYSFGQQGRGSIEFPTGAAERPDVTTLSAEGAVNQRFNRLNFRLRGGLTDHSESEVAGIAGTPGAINNGQDYRDTETTLRAAYEFSPGLAVFTEGGLNWRSYDASTGTTRDFHGRGGRVGAAAELAPTVTGEVSIGYAVETPDSPKLRGIEGVILDGNLTWRPSALTTLALRASSGVDATTTAGTIGGFRQSIGLDIRHEFRRYFALLAGIGYAHRDFAGTPIVEREVDGHIGLEYMLSREWVLTADYSRTKFSSTEAGRGYTDDVIMAGITLRR